MKPVPTNRPGLRVRQVAFDAIHQVLAYGKRLDSQLLATKSLKPDERAMARRIVMATLRHVGRADQVLAEVIERSPRLRVRNILRLALAEIHVCGTQPHAAVDLAVQLVGLDRRHFHSKGFVNAVLRRTTGKAGQIMWKKAGPTRLPQWIAEPVASYAGREVLHRIESAHEFEPPLDISLKRASEAAQLVEILDAQQLSKTSLRLRPKGQVSQLHGYAEGSWWVQDYAASRPVSLLGDLKGQSVLDLCAAPGGKTLQCAAAGATVTSLDRSENRLHVLRENLDRTKLEARVICCDALEWTSDELFDIVIIDVVCSATGTIRRHPDLPYRKQEVGWLERLAQTQRQFIAKAISHVRADGRLLYCVCSLLPQEGEWITRWAKTKHRLKSMPLRLTDPGADPLWETGEGGLRTRPDYWPHTGGMDGFYTEILSRSG